MLASAVSLDAFFYPLVFRLYSGHDVSMIEVSNLCFEYAGKQVLHDVSFSVKENSVVALVGPNGAGKTTLMRCLAALHTPLSGQVVIDGANTLDFPREVHRKIGYLSDFFGLYDQLTVRQCLMHMAGCQGVAREKMLQRLEEVCADTGLEGMMDNPAHTLSRGYRQRLGIGMALIHSPKFLILDEPASGMDPEARVALSSLIARLKAQGMTMIISSHILAELEDYCTDMLVIRDGRVRDYISQNSPEQQAISSVCVSAFDLEDDHLSHVRGLDGVQSVKRTDKGFDFSFSGDERDLASLLKSMTDQGIAVYGFQIMQRSLQKSYMDIAESNSADEIRDVPTPKKGRRL